LEFFLLMVILISRWFHIFNTMVRRLFYGWFISNSRTHTNSLRNGVRYKTFWLCQRKLNFWMLQQTMTTICS
jgi:hypothetical protein